MLSSAHKIHKRLSALIARAGQLGLPATDVKTSQGFLQAGEYVLCLDLVVTQLYEYEVAIDNEFYKEVEAVAKLMSMRENTYSYITELMK